MPVIETNLPTLQALFLLSSTLLLHTSLLHPLIPYLQVPSRTADIQPDVDETEARKSEQ